MRKKNLLYFYIGKASFVHVDLKIFNGIFNVTEFNFVPGAKWKTPFQFIAQFFFLLINIWRADVIIVQLAGFHSVLPVLFSKLTGRKSYIIASGTDCHSLPSIGYGNYQRRFLSFATRISFSFCSHVIPKHEALWYCDYTYQPDDYPHQGLKYFNPKLDKPHTVIENGFNPDHFKPVSARKPDSFLTVAGGMHFRFQKELKGIDLILAVAPAFPECSFTIVGVDDEKKFGPVPPNVFLKSSVPNNLLPGIYSTYTYYLQLSMAEGFPNALCEAMLCGCIPVGSNVFSIPEIIGDSGFILKKRDIKMLAELIREIRSSDISGLGKKARARIAGNFTISHREEKFRKLFIG